MSQQRQHSNNSSSSVDFLSTQGYFTLNPGCFDLKSWEQKSLQKLCAKLGIKTKGNREDLVRRLQQFHNDHRAAFGAGAFHNIGVDIHSPNKTSFKVDEKYVSPMVCRSNGGSILKRLQEANNALAIDRMDIVEDIDADDVVMNGMSENYNNNNNNGGSKTPSRTPQKTPRRKTTGGKSAKRIAFSPYNQVKLIPNRRDVKLYSPSTGSPGNYDENSYY
eukprot:g5442.t1